MYGDYSILDKCDKVGLMFALFCLFCFEFLNVGSVARELFSVLPFIIIIVIIISFHGTMA